MSGEPRRQSILVIDDSQDIHALIDVRLKPEDVVIHHALDAEAGREAMMRFHPDVVLLDLDLPGRDGISLCREMKEDPALASTIVIFLTGNLDVDVKVRAFDVGGADYVTKPFDAVELRARVRTALRTKRYLDMLATRAQIDGLTGLDNRSRFDEALAEAWAGWRARRAPASLALLDIDYFKRVNDTHGHPFGDQVLRRVADAIRRVLGPSETPYRYGGEEFAVLLPDCGIDAAESAAERMRAAVEALQLAKGAVTVPVTASFGVATLDADGVTEPADLVAQADRALYEAKRLGRNRVCRGVAC